MAEAKLEEGALLALDPSRAEEEEILDRMLVESAIDVQQLLDRDRLLDLRGAVDGAAVTFFFLAASVPSLTARYTR